MTSHTRFIVFMFSFFKNFKCLGSFFLLESAIQEILIDRATLVCFVTRASFLQFMLAAHLFLGRDVAGLPLFFFGEKQ